MAVLTIHTSRILDNIRKLDAFLSDHGIDWTLVIKLLNGHRPVLERLVASDEVQALHSVGDSRISNLRMVKSLNPDIRTMYIKPPAIKQADNIVRYADVSLNSSHKTIEALNKAARKQEKLHEIIVMIEMGELREGVVRGNVMDFYENIFKMENIKVVGIGTNLGCMHGVEPTFDKLIQLSLYAHLIAAHFNKEIPVVSGGSSITLPLFSRKRIPPGINHFRIGDTAFFGKSLSTHRQFRDLSTAAFDFSAEILEIGEKELVPDGEIGTAAIGQAVEVEEAVDGKRSMRALVDFGEIDVNATNLALKDKDVEFAGSTSDMTVYDIGNKGDKYDVGSKLHFTPNYTAVARLMHSRYIDKIVR